MKSYAVGVLGATGLVGQEILKILAQRQFPISELRLLASRRSEGTHLSFGGHSQLVQVATPDSFQGLDLLLASAGGKISEELVPFALQQGCIVIDNTSVFRLRDDVPLVVPEVNGEALRQHQGLIANPNCSTAQLVVALKPLHDAIPIRRVIVATYQAVSGAGSRAIEELYTQTEHLLDGQKASPHVLPYPIAFNLIPFIDDFEANGYTKEEMKITREVQKILDPTIATTATCIRVPVANCHSEAVTLEFAGPMSAERARSLLQAVPHIQVVDEIASRSFPSPLLCSGTDFVYVGRIREDVSHPNGLNLWIVADNLRKGAALNAVQIAEKLIELGLL